MSDSNAQHRQNTNPYNSGGGGFDAEDRYVAWCMTCWLAGVRPPGCVVPANYSLSRLAVQAPREIWLFDDLILTFEGNGAQKQIATSIKSGDYLKDGLPPKDLVEDVWQHASDRQHLLILMESVATSVSAGEQSPPIQKRDCKTALDTCRGR